ncbi:Hypothetical predicted protein, partial [Marmota monax]
DVLLSAEREDFTLLFKPPGLDDSEASLKDSVPPSRVAQNVSGLVDSNGRRRHTP